MLTLTDILAPLSVVDFITAHWGRVPLHLRAPRPDRFDALFDRRRFEELVANGRLPIYGTFNDDGNRKAARHGINNEIKLQPDQVDCLRAMTQVTLTMGSVHTVEPGIAALLTSVKLGLGHAGAIEGALWLSPPHVGLPVHFDECSSFMLQLAGTKVWRIGRKPAVAFPSMAGLRGENGEVLYNGYRQRGLVAAVEDWMERGDPSADELDELTLSPGDVLFVPAGVWHATSATEDSLGLNLRMHHASAWKVIGDALGRRLLGDPTWRQVLPLADCDAATHRRTLRAMLIAKVNELRDLLATGDAGELADALEAEWSAAVTDCAAPPVPAVALEPDTRLARTRLRPVLCREEGERLHVQAGDKSIAVTGVERELVARMLSGMPFRAGDVPAWIADGWAWEDARVLLDALVRDAQVLEILAG